MDWPDGRMTAEEFHEALQELFGADRGWGQRASAALGYNHSNVSRWWRGLLPVPAAVGVTVRLALRLNRLQMALSDSESGEAPGSRAAITPRS